MAKFKVGDRVKIGHELNKGTYEITSMSKDGKRALIHGNGEFDGWSVLTISLVAANSCSSNPVVQNALAARASNGQHFNGGGDALAEKIARAVQKYADANGGAKGKYLDEITTLSRTASSLAGGAWVMRDGSVALTDKQPRGATRLMDFVKTLNSAVAANAGVPFTRHGIYANLNDAQNRIVNAINAASHLEEPFKSKMAKGIAKLRNANDAITSAIAELAAAYKAAEAESGDS